jgi:hypothetical protein
MFHVVNFFSDKKFNFIQFISRDFYMSAKQDNQTLPLFYKELMPLNSSAHQAWRTKTTDKASWMANQHAVPLTTEEFVKAQRFFPIIFSSADTPVPLALMGLNEDRPMHIAQGMAREVSYILNLIEQSPALLDKGRQR